MQEYISSKGKKYQFYNSSKEMPIKRWNSFLSLMIQDSELGPNFDSASHKLGLMSQLVEANKIQEFNDTVSNLHLQLYYIFRGINPKINALAQRVHSIDGQNVTEITEDIISELKEDEKIIAGVLEELTEDFRKK